MVNSTRLSSDLSRLHGETDSYLATATSLSGSQLSEPSLCGSWDRAHVVAHLASNARAIAKLVDWAVTGRRQQPYSSRDARDAEIAELARLPREELLRVSEESAEHFERQCERLAGALAAEDLDLHGKPVTAAAIPAVRIAEVVLHHHDLDTSWTLADAQPQSVLDALEGAVRTMRAKDAPGMTLRTAEHDEWIIGDGGQLVTGDRVGMVLWLARGHTDGVSSEGALPELPAW
ncbi:maleylpyruvate isomerase family mycothiol-dependent enzyme [Kocuria tytonis]|uniref:Maleylpyruvate isomerase family mycothiol-dependent enzyme n=1 Tax=Kocuria tytonis TaxID=2054280 RepID=A0A495A9P4_9MICC|nr:maleylpyruvate isomerase family mycothiol-dependent enzyme [Kocuria tytonis]RKQ36791.1 maleylpyruvate isomerase family mycothiol-dependent enzyme [Kocuria tytonis]